MRFVSPLLKHAVYPALHHSGWLRRAAPRECCMVANYHGILPDGYTASDNFLDGNLVSAETFHRHIVFLKTRYHIIHPEDFRSWIETGSALPERSVLITCDDGLVNTLTGMLPILRREAVSCLFFVTGASCADEPGTLWYEELYNLLRVARSCGMDVALPGAVGDERGHPTNFQGRWWQFVIGASRWEAERRAAWMDDLRSRFGSERTLHSEGRYRLLSRTELLQLAESDVSIGAHTMTHPILSEASDQEARRELESCKTAIEETLRKKVWAFAYPFGNPATMGEREVLLAREAGFTCAFLNVGGGATDRSRPFELSRTHISASTTLAQLEANLVGFHDRLQHTIRS